MRVYTRVVNRPAGHVAGQLVLASTSLVIAWSPNKALANVSHYTVSRSSLVPRPSSFIRHEAGRSGDEANQEELEVFEPHILLWNTPAALTIDPINGIRESQGGMAGGVQSGIMLNLPDNSSSNQRREKFPLKV